MCFCKFCVLVYVARRDDVDVFLLWQTQKLVIAVDVPELL